MIINYIFPKYYARPSPLWTTTPPPLDDRIYAPAYKNSFCRKFGKIYLNFAY